MTLPEYFENYFRELMNPDEFEAFKGSFDGNRAHGIRINTLKLSAPEFKEIFKGSLAGIPWVPEGLYIDENTTPGKHPFYHAGLYYIQEPSAMMPARALSPEPGERVLDLCAAPGGKTTQIGCLMRNKGLIVSNDISPKRVKALVKNVELLGITNALIVNETPERLSRVFPEYFDRILLDMPCSGEGMFRKDRDAVKSYSRFKSSECVAMQREILGHAVGMLKPGGTAVYSTCTFNPDENERNMEYFMKEYGLLADKIGPCPGWEPSRGEWTEDKSESCSSGLRLWPHKAKGEGHFVFRLKKPGRENVGDDGQAAVQSVRGNTEIICDSSMTEKAVAVFKRFEEDNLNARITGVFTLRGSSLYKLPPGLNGVPGLRCEKIGLYLGEYKEGRFEPSGSLAMALSAGDFKRVMNIEAGDHSAIRYLKGETLSREGEPGYIAVCVEGFPLGWAKQERSILKNLYPKGWRML